VIAAGGVAFAVNTSVLDATVTAEQAPAGTARLVDEPAATDPAVAAESTVADPGQAVVAQEAATTLPPATRSAYDVQGLGLVTLEKTATALTVVSVDAATGVTADFVQESATRIEVRFVDRAGQSVKFHADVIGDRIVTSVMRDPSDGARAGARPPRDDRHHDDDDDDEHHEDEGHGDEGHEDDDD